MTKQLTTEDFERARNYIVSNGRPLERALFANHFEDGPAQAVLEALAAYQNEDGGFGHGLEADLRTETSSAIATSTAFYVFRDVGATAEEPMVQRGVDYLLSTYDAERQVWPIVPPEVNDAPRAWWWDYENSEEGFGGFLVNPTVAILGHLYDYQALVPAELLESLTAVAMARLAQLPEEPDMFSIFCYGGLADSPNLPESYRQQIINTLRPVVARTVVTDPAKWEEYGLLPLEVATKPDAPFADAVDPAAVEANLDFEIEQQAADGSWSPAWTWAERFPEAWATAEPELKGLITLTRLKTLRAFGRIE